MADGEVLAVAEVATEAVVVVSREVEVEVSFYFLVSLKFPFNGEFQVANIPLALAQSFWNKSS